MGINKQVKMSILVATCNRPEMLKTCIHSLFSQKTKIPYEIIILDQSDTDRQIPLSSDKPTIRVVTCNFKNRSHALNIGIKLASADYIAVIDDDCIADEYWIDSLYKTLQKEGCNSIITGRVVAGDREKDATRSRLHDVLEERVVFKKNKITPIFKLSGCNFGFHKSLHEKVGPFNENFGPGSDFKSSDDNEWSYRALNLGFQIVYSPNTIVIHRSWRNNKEDVRLMKDYGYAAGAFFKVIFINSKLDFLYHMIKLWLWILKNFLFSFNIHEAKVHFYYGLFFCKGFLKYRLKYRFDYKNINKFYDYVFVLSPGKYIGGAERYIQNLAKELHKQYDLDIIVMISHNFELYVECKDIVPSIFLGNTLWEASAKLSHFLKDNKVKAVISNGYHSSYLVFFSRLRNLFKDRGCKFLDIKHGWITTGFYDVLKTFLDKIVGIYYYRIILVNPSMKKSLWFINKKKILFIPSGISIEKNFICKPLKEKPFKILLVGRLSAEKRFKLVLEALSYIPKNIWHLTVVGDGPEKNTLQQIALQHNLYDRINFVGYQKNVDPFYQSTDLLIISSVNEGCPLVALEAMSHGVLVLSTKVGYMTTLLNEDRGFLVDVNITPAELAQKIKEIIKLDYLIKIKILKNAFVFVYKNHNLAKNVNLFKNILNFN
jgi:glycosyltransferase involved in cell wall biosynthesis/GT2 family glycosyltransferase